MKSKTSFSICRGFTEVKIVNKLPITIELGRAMPKKVYGRKDQ